MAALSRIAVLLGFAAVISSNTVYSASFLIQSDAGDGALQHVPTLSQQDVLPEITDARVGNGGPFPNRGNVNAVYLFELPDFSGGSLMDAELRFPYIDAENGFSSLDMDVWGLGYVASPTLDASWLYVGDNDPDPGINISSRQKIQDDVVGAVPDPGGTPVEVTTSDAGDTNLLSFIQSLYAQGAQAGDYAVIRLNDDRANPDPNVGGTGGFRVGFSEYSGGAPQLGLFDAMIIDWNNAGGGSYSAASNWSPANVPDNSPDSESARFDISGAYSVAFASGSTTAAADLLITRGSVAFETAAGATANATYNLDDQAIIDGGSLTVADSPSGFDVDLNVSGNVTINNASSLQINGGTFTSNGAITMSNSASLALNAGALHANAGLLLDNASLQTQAGATLNLGSLQPLTIQNGGTANFAGNRTIDNANAISVGGIGSTFTANGELTISGGSSLDINTGGVMSNDKAGAGLVVDNASAIIQGASSELDFIGAEGPSIDEDGAPGGSVTVQLGGQFDLDGLSTVRLDGGNGGSSGSGSGFGFAGMGGGGGLLRVSGGVMTLDGVVSSNGGEGGPSSFSALGRPGGNGGPGGQIDVSSGVLTLNGVVHALGGAGHVGGTAGSGAATTGGDGGRGGNGGGFIVTGGQFVMDGDIHANGGTGGNADPAEVTFAGDGGRGGAGGQVHVSGGVMHIAATLNARGGTGGRGGNGLFSGNGGSGGAGGQLNISGGEVSFTGTLNFQGGTGGNDVNEVPDAAGGAGGSVSITGGELKLLGGAIDLSGGSGATNGAEGSLNIAGGTLSVDASGPNSLDNILVAGQFNFAAGTLHVTDSDGFTIGASGRIASEIGGSAARLGPGQNLVIDSLLTIPAGTSLTLESGVGSADLTIVSSGASVTNASGSSLIAGPVVALAGSRIRVDSGILSIGDASAVDGFGSAGQMHIGSNSVVLLDANDAVFDSLASISLGDASNPGELDAAGGLTLDFGANIAGFGMVDTPNNPATPVINNGHITGNSLAEPVTLTGYVKGVGTCDNCNITGTDAPGFSTAAVNRGSVSYNGTLEIELGGTTPGRGYDQLKHILGAGVANLGGTLEVQLIDSFVPSAGDKFDIIHAASILGQFDTVSSPELPGDLLWFLNYTPTTVELVSTFGADFDEDGDVDQNDLVNWESGFGSTTAVHMTGDANIDSTADGFDFLVWQRQFRSGGQLAVAATVAPEPSSVTLTMLGAVVALLAVERQAQRGFGSGELPISKRSADLRSAP